MSESEELPRKSSDICRIFCTKCSEENCSCKDGIKFEDDSTSNQENQNSSNSKFLHKVCGEMFYVEDLIKHLGICVAQTSDKNEIKGKCEHCHRIVHNPTTKHLHVTQTKASECDEFCTDCPNCNMQNVKIKQHFLICPMKPKECNLSKLGCKGLLIPKDFTCTLFTKHMTLVNKNIKNISEKIKIFQNFDVDVKHETKEIDKIIENIEELKVAILESRERFRIPRSGKLIWRIDNAFDFLKKEKPEIGTAVYTSDFGYKLCLKIFPKGDGIGLNNYFSIFFVIMKGDYDDLLSWPFKNKIKVTLYNSVISKSKNEIYKPDNSDAFHKPNKKYNLATGNPKFISLKELKESGFIIDNCLFIELNMEQTKTRF